MSTTPSDRRPSDVVRASINNRARAYISSAVEDAYQADLVRWAGDDSAPFPSRNTIRTRLEDELHILCHGLETWAAAHPTEFFTHNDLRIREADAQHDRDCWDYWHHHGGAGAPPHHRRPRAAPTTPASLARALGQCGPVLGVAVDRLPTGLKNAREHTLHAHADVRGFRLLKRAWVRGQSASGAPRPHWVPCEHARAGDTRRRPRG